MVTECATKLNIFLLKLTDNSRKAFMFCRSPFFFEI